MPEQTPIQNTDSQPSSGAPPGGDPQTTPNPSQEPPQPQAPLGLKGTDLRYQTDADVPDWAKGKTADEILAIAETMRNSLVTQPPQTQPTPTTQQTTVQKQQALDPDLIYNDAAAYTQQMAGYVDQSVQRQIAAAATPILTPMVSLARDTASRDASMAEVWSKYGPEIDMTMTNVPMQNRADVAMWRQAAELVAGKHYKELARGEAERLASTADSGMLSSGGGVGTASPTSGDPIDRLFADDHPSIQAFKRIGKSAADIRQHALTMGHSSEAYAEMLKNKRTLRYSETMKDGVTHEH